MARRTSTPLPARLAFGLLALVILALDFAALDDITTGSQPGFAIEWTWLAVSTVFLVFLWWRFQRGRRRHQV